MLPSCDFDRVLPCTRARHDVPLLRLCIVCSSWTAIFALFNPQSLQCHASVPQAMLTRNYVLLCQS